MGATSRSDATKFASHMEKKQRGNAAAATRAATSILLAMESVSRMEGYNKGNSAAILGVTCILVATELELRMRNMIKKCCSHYRDEKHIVSNGGCVIHGVIVKCCSHDGCNKQVQNN